MSKYSMKRHKEDSTGSHLDIVRGVKKEIRFNEFEISIEVSEDNEFIRISEIRVSKDFISNEDLRRSHDVDEFYED